MRNLATIQIIKEIENIPDKDRIGLASFRDVGWKVIVAKEESYPGQKVVYFEPDSIIPEGFSEFEFLKARCFSNKYHGYKIHCMKMSGTFSYGLAIPVEKFSSRGFYSKLESMKSNDDCTELFGVLHKDDERFSDNRPLYMRQKPKPKGFLKKFLKAIKKLFGLVEYEIGSEKRPSVIRQTDETRAENLNVLWEPEFQDKNIPIYATMKMDGQSASYAIVNDEFWVCSRNVALYHDKVSKAIKWFVKNRITKENILNMVSKYDILNKLIAFQNEHKWNGVLIQGECYGPGIQSNRMGESEVKLALFNLIQIRNKEENLHYSWNSISEFCGKYEIPHVPFLDSFVWNSKLHSHFANIETTRKWVNKFKYGNGVQAEGVVFREHVHNKEYLEDVMSWNSCRDFSHEISFKVISPNYLLKYDK